MTFRSVVWLNPQQPVWFSGKCLVPAIDKPRQIWPKWEALDCSIFPGTGQEEIMHFFVCWKYSLHYSVDFSNSIYALLLMHFLLIFYSPIYFILTFSLGHFEHFNIFVVPLIFVQCFLCYILLFWIIYYFHFTIF